LGKIWEIGGIVTIREIDKMGNWGNRRNYKNKGKLEYRKFRVRGHIRSFRDLEIYKQTTLLSSQIYDIDLPPKIKGKKLLEEELEILRNISKQIPRLIAESYGDRFTSRQKAYDKLEEAAQQNSQVIAKLDFLIAAAEHPETKQIFIKLIRKYQTQKRKTLNLKKAWLRVEEARSKK
jgi:hypothetical protein